MADKHLFIDIETKPEGDLSDFEIEKEPPKNIKDPLKIQKWYEENKEKLFRNQALDPNKADIISIACAFDEEETIAIYDPDHDSESEYFNLLKLQEFIEEKTKEIINEEHEFTHDLIWVGHNIRKFDLEVIWTKAIKYQLYPLAKLIPRKPYSDKIIDIMEIWTGPRRDYVSMDTVLKTLNIGEKTEGMDGSKVYDEFLLGNLESIIVPYNIDDVDSVRKIFYHITKGLNYKGHHIS